MPELPEVEIIVQALRPCLSGLIPLKLVCKQTKILRTPEILPLALGHPIKDIMRKGKLIIFLAPPYVWLIHLKMTGQLWWQPKTAPLPHYTHLLVSFAQTDYQLRYADLRQFGYWQIVPEEEMKEVTFLKKLGPDALTITPSQLAHRLQKRHAPIKTLLLNQQCIAGLGNIYSDEALWLAKINPLTPASALTKTQINRLASSIRTVLKQGLKLGGTSIQSYIQPNGKRGNYQDYRLVYRRENLPCLRCNTPIKRIKIGGRSSYFCPSCQDNGPTT